MKANQPGSELARAIGPLFVLGPILAGIAILAQHPKGVHLPELTVVLALAWLIGLAMLSGKLDSLTPGFFLFAAYAGNIMLSAAILLSGTSDFGLIFLYLWEVPFVFHYYRLRHALPLVAFTALCYATVAIGQFNHGSALREGRWISMVGTLVILGFAVYQLSENVKRSRQRFRSIFQYGPLGMALVRDDGTVLEINSALERLAGRSASELLGQPLGQYLHEDDLPKWTNALVLLDSEGEQSQVDCRILPPDGSPREAMITISTIRNAAGKLAGYVVIVEDLTERRRAERAEAENQAKTRFLALMSHELRTPLNAVIGFSQLLEHRDFGPLNDRQARYVSNIRTAGQNLLTLVNDLLDFSKVSAERMDFHLELVNVEELVEEAVGSMRPSADDKQLSLEYTVEPGLTAYADKFRLRQVLLNLLSNGIKFTKSGSVTVKGEATGEKTCISVNDTGIGIAADQVPKLFSEFSQLDSGFARTQPGTGLGLALSKRLVFGMGGTIQVESRDGSGSTFTVVIPRAAPSSEPTP